MCRSWLRGICFTIEHSDLVARQRQHMSKAPRRADNRLSQCTRIGQRASTCYTARNSEPLDSKDGLFESAWLTQADCNRKVFSQMEVENAATPRPQD